MTTKRVPMEISINFIVINKFEQTNVEKFTVMKLLAEASIINWLNRRLADVSHRYRITAQIDL